MSAGNPRIRSRRQRRQWTDGDRRRPSRLNSKWLQPLWSWAPFLSLALVFQRETERRRRATGIARQRPERAAMRFDDAFADRQREPESAAPFVERRERRARH